MTYGFSRPPGMINSQSRLRFLMRLSCITAAVQVRTRQAGRRRRKAVVVGSLDHARLRSPLGHAGGVLHGYRLWLTLAVCFIEQFAIGADDVHLHALEAKLVCAFYGVPPRDEFTPIASDSRFCEDGLYNV